MENGSSNHITNICSLVGLNFSSWHREQAFVTRVTGIGIRRFYHKQYESKEQNSDRIGENLSKVYLVSYNS